MATYYDISLDFSLTSTGDLSLAEDSKALSQAIHNIIYTPKGFKCGTGINPIFGLGINKYVFAPLNSYAAKVIAEDIYRQLRVFEPRIEIDLVDVVADTQNKLFEITINYYAKPIEKKLTYITTITQA